IHDGKLEEFRQLGTQAFEIVRDQEPGTLFYEWFFNEDETECVALDCYENVDALMEHVAHVGPIMRQIMAITDRYLEIYGANPMERLMAGRSTAASNDFYGELFVGKL